MRLASLPLANIAVGERRRLLALREAVESDKLQVVISSAYQDDAMVALVRPVLAREINARLHRVEAELKALGVEL